MSTTVAPLNEQLHFVALNLSPEVVLQRNLLHYCKRDGSTYLELENHSDALRDMNKFTTPTVIISGLRIQLHCADAHTTRLREPLGGYNSGQWARLREHYICEEHALTELRQDMVFLQQVKLITSMWHRTTQQTTLHSSSVIFKEKRCAFYNHLI